MNNLSQCPDCHSANIKFYEARKSYSCFDCGKSFSDEIKVAKKLRIFLSYGHDANEELVRLIKKDLEKRGHDVWFDKNEIKFGDEWRRSITDGIISSNCVLSFLSKYSTRDPGVCRDEIAIAIGVKGGNIQTILVESEQEVQPPVNIGHIQWLDMHEWKRLKESDDTAWRQWYQEKLAEIISVVESDESHRFAGEIEKLNEFLKPIKSEARISGLLSKGFFGREWLFEAVENWRKENMHDSRLFWIMGDPGVGKSAFAAQLTHKHGDTVIAAQFCEWDKLDHRDARRVVCSIAFQMATRLPDYRKLLLTLPEIKELDRKDASELFDYLLANTLKSVINGGHEKLLIVIDALDEAGESGRNPLVEMLARNAHHLPKWLGIVVTSRPEFDVKTPFQALSPLPIATNSNFNKEDIRKCLNSRLVSQLMNRSNAGNLVEQILEKSEGIFLYIEMFCDDIQHGYISLDCPDQFPQGLGGIFAQYFQRQFPDLEKFRKEIRPALRAILAAREPLPLEILQKLFNWEDEELRDFIHILGSLFPVTKTTDSETIKPYHKSLADWLGDEAKAGVYIVSVTEGHRNLRDFCRIFWTKDNFALSHFPGHLAHCGNWEEISNLLITCDFIRAKRLRLGYEALSKDYQWVEECIAAFKSDYERCLFNRVTAAVRSLSGFSGRRNETAQIEHFLFNEEVRFLIVDGVGGIGKTLLMEHVWLGDILNRVFVSAPNVNQTRTHDLLGNIIANVIEQLIGRIPNSIELSSGVRLIAKLNPQLQCIIVDGLDEIVGNFNNVINGLAQSGFKIVLTTRQSEKITQALGNNAEYLTLSSLSVLESFEYFRKLGLIDAYTTETDSKELFQELGGLPLALAMSGAYIKGKGCTITEYLESIRKTQKELESGSGDNSMTVHGLLRKALIDFSATEQIRLAELCIAVEAEPISLVAVQKLWFEFGHMSADSSMVLLTKFKDHNLIKIDIKDSNWKISIHKLIKQLMKQLNLLI
ncbi:MAG: toll/interleukin-1 receptor domain-containing protein [Bacteroidetes bacterium]|nr:toll/interleukin-1 receptor domain-containing protein [Bacteroidota bacterium]